MSFCENPECREAFDPTETANGYCSWECEEQHNDTMTKEI